MELHLTAEQEARLVRLAQHEGKEPETFATERILAVFDDDDQFRIAVQQGLDQADAGNFMEEEEMDRRFAKMLSR